MDDDTMDKLLLCMKDLPRSIENSDEVFKFLLGRINSLGKLAPPDIASLCSVVAGLALPNHQKEKLAIGIVESAKKKAKRRPMQDWTSARNFFTQQIWKQAMDHPVLAMELFVQHLSSGGLICPSEPTSALVAAMVFMLQGGDDNSFAFISVV